MAQQTGQRIGYARVSSTDQNLARQLTALGEVNRVFEEKQSGAKREGRTALADLIGYSFAQLERAITRERQAEGIRAAKARGVYQGRARKLTAEQLAQASELIATGVPKAQVARQLSIDRSTLYRSLARNPGS